MMSRFFITSLLAVPTFFAIGFFLSGPTRWWAFTGFWIVYLTMVGCGIGFIRMQFFSHAICQGKTGQMKVALTFDDGPEPAATSALLELLAREKIPAAFFCIGKKVTAHPDIVARIAAEGHLLGNHTYNHRWFTSMLGPRGLEREIVMTQEAIASATGTKPMYMRPPFGQTNPHYGRVLRRNGLQLLGWNVRSLDTFGSSQSAIDRVVEKARDGSIILLHDGAGGSPQRVVEITSNIITQLRGKGFGFERLDRLIGEENHSGKSAGPIGNSSAR